MDRRLVLATCLVVLSAPIGLLSGCGENAAPYRVSGDSALERGDPNTAIAEYERYIAIDPGNSSVLYNYGRALIAANRHADAVRPLATVSGIEPFNSAFTDAYAEALLGAGRRDDLVRFLQTRTREQGDTSTWLRLGRFAARAGDADLARQSLLIAARIDGGKTVEPQLALSDFFASVKDEVNAYERLRMAFFVAPNDRGVLNRMNARGLRANPLFGIEPPERRAAQPSTTPEPGSAPATAPSPAPAR